MYARMKEIERYAGLIETVFGIEGLMALAWYALSTRRSVMKGMGRRIPHLILCGHPGMGKTELAHAIAAVDVPEGLDDRAAFHLLPNMGFQFTKELVLGTASFCVLEELRMSTDAKVVEVLNKEEPLSPLLLITCLHEHEWRQIADSSIVINMPRRSFSVYDRENLQMLRGAEKMAFQLRKAMYSEPEELEATVKLRYDRIINCVEKETTFRVDEDCMRIAAYYALIIGNWEASGFGDSGTASKLEGYALQCLFDRLDICQRSQNGNRTVLKKEANADGSITLSWMQPERKEQSVSFADGLQFKAFTHMLKMMEATEAESVEVCV